MSTNKLGEQTEPKGIHIAPCSLNVTCGPRLICRAVTGVFRGPAWKTGGRPILSLDYKSNNSSSGRDALYLGYVLGKSHQRIRAHGPGH